MKAEEKFLAKLANESFLSLWRFPVPTDRKSGKELCSLLVVCDPHVLIFSMKKIPWKDTGDEQADFELWQKGSMEAITEDLQATAHWINKEFDQREKASHEGLPFPNASRRRMYRIGVALGGTRSQPLAQGDAGDGYVHLFDQTSLDILLFELDTMPDFINYLYAKENIGSINKEFSIYEEDLLAVYFTTKQKETGSRKSAKHGKSAKRDQSSKSGPVGWEEYFQSDDYWKTRDNQKASYTWDNLINGLRKSCREEFWQLEDDLTHTERAVRTMARESRFERLCMAKLFIEYIQGPRDLANRACILLSPSGVSYMMMIAKEDEPAEQWEEELGMRTLIARNLPNGGPVVVGLAIVESADQRGFRMYARHIDRPDWPDDLKVQVSQIQRKTGYFRDPKSP